MTVTSHFYDTLPGEGINEIEWAEAAQSRMSLYGVASASELLCTPHPSTPYTVNISPAPKGFWGHGVWDTSDAVVSITFTPPPTPPLAGSRRFDLVAARRDWTPTGGGPTAIMGIQGSTARALPAPPARAVKPGEIHDQPLWLVEWLGGQTQPQSITDLRLIGGLEAVDPLVLKYMEVPGQPVKLAGSTWFYEMVGNGQWAHREYLKFERDVLVNIPAPAGWQVGPAGFCVVKRVLAGGKSQVTLSGQLIRTGEPFAIGNRPLGALIPVGYRPLDNLDFHAGMNTSTNAYLGSFDIRITNGGTFILNPIDDARYIIEKFGNLNFSGTWVI